jgi:predicted DNA-binding protein (UPF0251 family)
VTNAQFDRLIAASNLRGERTIQACRLVKVEGLTAYAAAKQTGINQSAISRALAKIPKRICPTCRRPYL